MRIIRALRAISTDANISTEEKLQRLLKLGLDALGLDIGLISQIEGDVYEVVAAATPDNSIQKGDSFSLGDTFCRDTLAADSIVCYNDASQHPGVSHPGVENFRLNAYIGIPFHVSGKRFGTINFSSKTALNQTFSVEQQDYLVLLAEWVGTELTRQQQMQALLKQQEVMEHQHKLHLQMSKLAKVGTWEMNQSTDEVTLSDSLMKMFEIEEDTVLNFEVMRAVIYRDADLEKIREMMNRAKTTNEPWSVEYEAKTMTGKRFWAHSQGAVDMSDKDNIRFYGATQDITDHIQVNKELELRRAVAERALASRSQFLANMSHEIRTPINGIVGMINALTNTHLEEKQLEFCRLATQSAESLLQIVNDVLDFSKIDAGEFELENIPLNIAKIAEEQWRIFQIPATKKGLSFEFDCGTTKELKLCGDPTRLRQIISNLLSNAIKFTESGKISLTLRSKPQRDDRHLIQIVVEDEGIGIKPQHQASIFSPFRQGDSETTRRFGGTGLGLSIVAQIAELMQGGVRVNSEYGKGAKFIVALSLQVASDEQRVEYDLPEESSELYSSIAGKSVLLVEDNEINQLVVTEQLKQYDIIAEVALEGAEALEKVERKLFQGECYDLILMDCQMPVMDGYQATSKIRQLGTRAQRIPIIALTANVLVGEREKCLKAGMNDYLSKPIDKQLFSRCLHRYLLV